MIFIQQSEVCEKAEAVRLWQLMVYFKSLSGNTEDR